MNVNETALSFRWRQPGGIIALLFILVTISPATGQTSLDVHVTNIAIAGELSARGLTAAFPHPVMAAITVTDNNGNPILGLADTSRWLAPQDLAEIGIPVSQIWKRLLEYHRDAPSFPSNPDIYQQIPAPLVTEFRQTTPFPTSTMLVMDVSGSMSEELADAKGAARLFVDLLRPIDRAGVVQFSHTIAAFQEFTNDKQKLLAIIDSAKADGATALYDALVYAVQATRRENSRRAIIVYTDGVDISSTLTPTAVIDSARFYSTPIFTISLGNGTNPDTLKRIAKETGGLFFQTHDAVEFKAIYQRIAALIQNFYMLAYSSPDPARNDTWRRLEVTVCDEQKNLGMSTGDYFVPGGPPLRDTDLAVTQFVKTDSFVVSGNDTVYFAGNGETINYRVVVANLGLIEAHNVRVTDFLPDSVRASNFQLPPDGANVDSVLWTITRLPPQSSTSFTFNATVAPKMPVGTNLLINRATVKADNEDPAKLANNTSIDTVFNIIKSPAIADLALAFNSRTNSTIVENGRIVNAVKPGEPIDYKIRVRNLGPEQAGNIRVRQLLPDSVRFVSASKPLAITNRDSVIWQISSLASGGVDSITISVLFAARVPPTLTQLISRANLTSPNDVSPANNSASDTVRVVFPPPLPPTDLAVTLASQTGLTIFENGRNVNAAKPGQRYDYRLRVRNFGPAAAENIRLRQSLPDSVRFIAASKPPALATRDSLIWEITSLNAGGSDSINVSVQFAPSVPQNLARLISRLTLFAANDNSPNNNVARDTVRVVIPPPPGSRPLIEARPPEVTIGDSVRVRVQVPAPIVAWDLWVYYANGQIDSSYAEAYIKTTRLAPNVWFDVAPVFTNTRLFTAAKEEEIRFEIRSRDIFGEFTTASDAVLVRSSNDLVLDRNVYEADRQSPLGINFRLSSNREARLEVYDLNGVCITKLVEAPFNAGWNTYNWNGQTETGRPVGSGVYIIALRSGEFNAWKKCIIVR